MFHNGPVLGANLRNTRLSILLFAAGIVLLGLFYWFFIQSYDVPKRASPAVGPMEITTPDGIAKMAPATWFSGAGSDPAFKPGVYRFAFSIPIAASDADRGAEWLFFIPQAYGNALRVNVGGEDVGSLGDMVGGESNIWSPGKVFRVKPGLVRSSTRVVIEINGRYEAGFTKRPYLMPAKAGIWKALFFKIFTDLGIWVLCGAILALGFTILIIGAFSTPRFDSRFFFSLAAICAAIFLSDYQSIEFLPFGLLAFKRLVSISRHLSAALFAVAVCRMLCRKKDKFVMAYAALQTVLMIALLFPQTMPALKRAYSITYLGIFPVLVYLPIILFTRGRERDATARAGFAENRAPPMGYGLLLFGACAGIGAGMYDTTALMIRPGGVCVSQYGFLILFLSVAAYVITDVLGRFRQLVVEKMRSERFQHEALRDHLTDAFNRKILPLILDETRMKTAVVMIDLDDLKGINDNYGHQVGDIVLKDLVATVRRNIRQSDYLVRLGGDEFVAFLPGCPERKTEFIVKHLLSDLSESRVPFSDHAEAPFGDGARSDSILSYRASIGTAVSADEGLRSFDEIQDLIAKADAALYKSKTSGKAKATFG
jgi:diguanylate cyclase (GGDEF)-like protein